MSRIIQPSVAKRITFATWARKEGFNRRSTATWSVPDGTEIPETLLQGAQIDGKPYEPPEAPKRTRTRKRKDTGPIEEPAPPLRSTPTGYTYEPNPGPSQDDTVPPEQTQEE